MGGQENAVVLEHGLQLLQGVENGNVRVQIHHAVCLEPVQNFQSCHGLHSGAKLRDGVLEEEGLYIVNGGKIPAVKDFVHRLLAGVHPLGQGIGADNHKFGLRIVFFQGLPQGTGLGKVICCNAGKIAGHDILLTYTLKIQLGMIIAVAGTVPEISCPFLPEQLLFSGEAGFVGTFRIGFPGNAFVVV